MVMQNDVIHPLPNDFKVICSVLARTKITFNQRGTISSAPVGDIALVETDKKGHKVDFKTAVVDCCAALEFTAAIFFSPKWN